MTPVPYRVTARTAENRDTATLTLAPMREALPSPQPGEFMMMYAFGIGEVAISVSGIDDPDGGLLAHTVRSVGGAPSLGKNWVKRSSGVAMAHSSSSSLPSIRGARVVRKARIDLALSPSSTEATALPVTVELLQAIAPRLRDCGTTLSGSAARPGGLHRSDPPC